MKIELSDYFKRQGFRSAYLFTNNMGRACVEIIHSNRKKDGGKIKRFISYAKYVWISANNQEVPDGYEVDHINGNSSDDRIDNLQILSKHDNILKEKEQNNKLGRVVVDLICPVCGATFTKRYAYVMKVKSQKCCCSRQCSGCLSNMGLPFNKDAYIKECMERSKKIPAEDVRY